MGEERLRFGIVGTGNIASFHARALAEVRGAELTAVTARRREAGEAFAREFQCAYEPDLEKFLAHTDVDAVAIATPSGTHAEVGIAAARAGKHVFCEKPIDVTLEKIDRLIEACRDNGVQLGAVFQSRMGQGALALRRAVEGNRFGRLSQCSAFIPWYRSDEYYESAEWRGTWELDGGGALMNQGIHAVDLLLWLAGDVAELSARCDNRLHSGIEVEDNAIAWLRFANGALGAIQGSTCSWPGQRKRIEIMGEHGTAILEDDVVRVWKFAEERPEDEGIRVGAEPSNIGGGASDPKAISTEGHRRLYEDFVAAVSEGRPTKISGEEARKAVELILAIYRSSRENAIVRLQEGALAPLEVER